MNYYKTASKTLWANYRIRCKSEVKWWYSAIWYLIIFALYFCCFLPQAYIPTIDEGIYSDISIHMKFGSMLFEEGGLPAISRLYPITYVLMGVLQKLSGDIAVGATLATGIMAMASTFCTIQVLRYFLKPILSDYILTPLGILLNVAWPIFVQPISDAIVGCKNVGSLSLYVATGASAPIHNATVISVKSFAMITILLFLWLLRQFKYCAKGVDKEQGAKQNIVCVCLAFVLIGANLAKPSFFQTFAFAGAILVLIFWLCYGNKAFKLCVKIGLSFIPATLQILLSLGGALKGAVAISPFMVWSYYAKNIWLAIFVVIAFPLFILLCRMAYRKFDIKLTLGFLMLTVGIIEYIFLMEPAQAFACNYIWGYNISQFVLYVLAFVSFAEFVHKRESKKYIKTIKYLGYGVFSLHLISGLYAFITYPIGFWGFLK